MKINCLIWSSSSCTPLDMGSLGEFLKLDAWFGLVPRHMAVHFGGWQAGGVFGVCPSELLGHRILRITPLE